MLKERLKQPSCQIGLHSYCCKHCLMGPCILTQTNKTGVCGANLDVVTSRNILRFVAGGAATHAGHAYHVLKFQEKKYPKNYIKKKAPPYLYKLWNDLDIVPKVRYEHFKDISESLHASTMGVDADYQHILKLAMKLGIIDGYYGMYLATELEDSYHGKPKITKGKIDLGVINPNKVNIAVHGHEPTLASVMAEEAKKPENKDINLIGVCCTGASILNRYGIPQAANFVLQEDVIATGAIEAMVVDVQCVMPSLSNLVECYHTRLITTNNLARMPHALHLPFNKKTVRLIVQRIFKIARANKKNRKKIKIPKNKKTNVTVGFTPDNLNLEKISEDIKKKKIKGVIAVIGCNNPRVTEKWEETYKKLSKDYIILTTGCMAFKLGQAGLLDGKRVFHMGSCVNNARIAETFKRLADMNNKKITDMPFLVSCPKPITEKAVAIGFFFAALGTDVHFGYPFMLNSNSNISGFLANVLKDKFESRIFLEMDPCKLQKQL